MKREVLLPVFPLRIVSLVPSQTELLFDLGLGDRVVGVTKFCIHPKGWLESKLRIGGTKNINLKKIEELQPDLIIGNKEENTQEDIEKLAKKYPVWMSDVNSFSEALTMISQIGTITKKVIESEEIIKKITQVAENFTPITPPKNILYFIWHDPWMVVGRNTFIDNVLSMLGYNNLVENERYIELSLQSIIDKNPAIIFLSSEPFPFKEKHANELQKYLPNTEIKRVDGEIYSWYGSRMINVFK